MERADRMSGIIKPKDIPDEMMGDGRSCFCDFLAAVLNHAIEVGVVSPPVWAIRNIKTGALVERRGVPVLVLDGNPTDSDIWTKEHWKGQTE